MDALNQREQHMKHIYHLVLNLGTHVEEALAKALHVLIDRNFQVAEEIHAHDSYIDNLRNTIEDTCVNIIETQKPVSITLRELITLIKVSADLERIGDLAQHLARIVQDAGDQLIEQTQPKLEVMINLGINMLHQSLVALSTNNISLAEEVAKLDDLMDKAQVELDEILLSIMKESPEFLVQGVELLRMSRFLERLGDRVINICEWIVYAKNGTHINF